MFAHLFKLFVDKPYLRYLGRAFVLALFLVLIFFTLRKNDFPALYQTFSKQLSFEALPYLISVLILMVINWWLEAIKWQLLMKPINVLTLIDSAKAVLIGLTTSIFTPNRIGEYLGRVFVSTTDKRWQAAVALSLGSILQMALIGGLGIAALLYFFNVPTAQPILGRLSYGLLCLVVTIMFLAYFYAGSIVTFCQRHFKSVLASFLPHLRFITFYSNAKLWVLLVYSMIRIAVYVFQYALLLRFFGVEVPIDLAICAILITYLFQTGLPLPTVLSLLARGEIALLIWNYFDVNELSTLATSYGLWVINVALPALLGMVLVLKLEPTRTHKI
jgi:hypothetical protein